MKCIGTISMLRVAAPTMALALVLAASASAQYSITEDSFNSGSTTADLGPNTGPVRLARFSLVEGKVTWRPSSDVEWSEASINLPLQQSGQVWVDRGGRAEVQFDDGSVLRLAGGAIVTLQTLSSDSKGEFTLIKLNQGLAYMRLRSSASEYEVDTPLSAIRAFGPAKIRIGASEGTEIGVHEGEVRVEGTRGNVTLRRDDYVAITDRTGDYDVRRIPGSDRWDSYNDDRDAILDRPNANLPSNIALVASDLDDYGDWRQDEEYGNVWCPRGVNSSWEPYREGRWVWTNPFGWTWCGAERWGWAPYHYGSWVRRHYGWAWCPGPVNQYWSPAVVHFTEYDGNIAWCALSPRDIRYPTSLFVGFGGGNWAASFSIGGAACYVPQGNYCEPRPWHNNWVNHYGWRDHKGWNSNPGSILDLPHTNGHFVPHNAQGGWGVNQASQHEFANGGNFGKPKGGGWVFEKGQDRPGGWGVRPGNGSFTPSHKLDKKDGPAPELLVRPIFRPTTNPRDDKGWSGSNPGRPEKGTVGWGGKDKPQDLGGGNVRPDRPRPTDPPIQRPQEDRPDSGWGTRPRPNDPPQTKPSDPRPDNGWGTRPRPADPVQPRPQDPRPDNGWGTRPRPNDPPVRDNSGGWNRPAPSNPRPDRNPPSLGRPDRTPRTDPGRTQPRGWGGSSPRQGRDSGGGKKDRKGGGGWG